LKIEDRRLRIENRKPRLEPGFAIVSSLFSIFYLLVITNAFAQGWIGASEKLRQLEQRTIEQVNQERTRRGLRPLVIDTALTKAARRHSQDMSKRQFFSHVNPDGDTPLERVRLAGARLIRMISENLGLSRGSDDPVAVNVRGWMESPPHRQNILDKRFKYTGVGIAQALDDTFYFTQLFADSR
jgi:uncharacterized protein YkwD